MGFCRRCGDIVHGPRCKCGGVPVAPVVQVSSDRKERSPDRWTQTYTSQPVSSATTTRNDTGSQPLTSALKKLNRAFPRPAPRLGAAVSAHIAASTAERPPSPLKQQYSLAKLDIENMPADGILPAPDNSTQLSKVYGSVLQPRDSLTLHSCAHCRTAFLPDETIFPDPTAARSFVCRSCFTANGGSKGDCASCGRVVLGLANEGGFIESAGRVWHKRCFRCASCHADISARPMVDLLGRPSCADCFEHCLKPKAAASTSPTTPTKPGNIGGMKAPGARSREGSPALEELHAKLGIKATPPRPSLSREASPAVEERRERTSARFTSPLMVHRSRSTPSLDTTPTKPAPPPSSPSTSPFSWSRKPTTPVQEFGTSPGWDATATLKGRKRAPPPDPVDTGKLEDDARCATCDTALFSVAGGGRIVRVDGASFHAGCFTCDVCRRPFREDGRGQALFVRGAGGRGRVHVECGPQEKPPTFMQHRARAQSVDVSVHAKPPGPYSFKSPSMVDVSAPFKSPPLPNAFKSPSMVDVSGFKSPPPPGGRTCPGCGGGVAPMERGVVQGPGGSRWHATCLVCGGKGGPGCGKKLDSGARCDDGGTAWCRECWMLQPRSPQPSPLSPSFTGSLWSSRPLQRQQTGQSVSNAGLGFLSRQNTGTSRPGSPVKQLGITHSLSTKPRPQSVGRGMFLVKQLTGAGSS